MPDFLDQKGINELIHQVEAADTDSTSKDVPPIKYVESIQPKKITIYQHRPKSNNNQRINFSCNESLPEIIASKYSFTFLKFFYKMATLNTNEKIQNQLHISFKIKLQEALSLRKDLEALRNFQQSHTQFHLLSDNSTSKKNIEMVTQYDKKVNCNLFALIDQKHPEIIDQIKDFSEEKLNNLILTSTLVSASNLGICNINKISSLDKWRELYNEKNDIPLPEEKQEEHPQLKTTQPPATEAIDLISSIS